MYCTVYYGVLGLTPADLQHQLRTGQRIRRRPGYDLCIYSIRISVIKKTAKQLLCKSAEKVAVNRYSIQLILWLDILPCPADLIPRYPHLCS